MLSIINNIFSYIVWFFQEMTLLSSLLFIILILGAIFLISYCVGILGAGSSHSFWTKIVHFLKHDTPTSFETMAKSDPNGRSIRSSYFKYRKQRRRIKHFWQSAAVIFGFKIIIIILVSGVFTNNPLKAQNVLEVTDLNQAIAANQGFAAAVENPEQSPEDYYFFEKKGEIKEEIITGAELKSIKENNQGLAQLSEFKELSSEPEDLKINQESLNLIRIDEEKTIGDKIEELFFKRPFSFQEPDLILAVSSEGEILPVEMEGIDEADQLIFSYEYGTYSESYLTEETTVEVSDDLEIEFDNNGEPESDLSKGYFRNLIKTAQAQNKTAKAIRVKLKADTEAGYQVFQVNPDGSLYLYDGEELSVASRPVFEYYHGTWSMEHETREREQGAGSSEEENLKTEEEPSSDSADEASEPAEEDISTPSVEEDPVEESETVEENQNLEPIPAKPAEIAPDESLPKPELAPEPEPAPEPTPEPANEEAGEPISFWQRIFNKIFVAQAQEETVDSPEIEPLLIEPEPATVSEEAEEPADNRLEPAWQSYTFKKVKISKKLLEDHIEVLLKITTQENDEILMKYEFGFDGVDYLKKQSWSIDTEKQVRMNWEIQSQISNLKSQNQNSKLKIELESEKITQLDYLKIDVSDYEGEVRTEVNEGENKVNIYFEDLISVERIYTIDPSLWLATNSTSVTVQTGGLTTSDFKLVFNTADAGISEAYKGTGSNWSTNYLSAAELLTELDQDADYQVNKTSTVKVLENTAARVIVKNEFSLGSEADVTEFWHIYPSGKIHKYIKYVKNGAGTEARAVDDGATDFVASGMYSYYLSEPATDRAAAIYWDSQLIDIISQNQQEITEFQNPAPQNINFNSGSLNISAEEDAGGDGFNEAEGAYKITGQQAQETTAAFAFGGNVYKPVISIRDVAPTSGDGLLNHTKIHLALDGNLESAGIADGELAISSIGQIVYDSQNRVSGQSVLFNPENSGKIAINSQIVINPEASTVEFWYKPNYNFDDNEEHLLFTNQKQDINKNYIQLEKNSANDLVFHFVDDSAIDHQARVILANDYPFKAGEWITIRIAWTAQEQSENIEIYLNGMATQERYENNQQIQIAPWADEQNLLIGGASFNGYLDDFAIYNENLIDEPINELRLAYNGQTLVKNQDFALDFGKSLDQRIISFFIDIEPDKFIIISQKPTTENLVIWEVKDFDESFLLNNTEIKQEGNSKYIVLAKQDELYY
ncbi:hypothetical protein COT20_02305, partial [bacterium (Candidatus Gribaldobacteria) CG08_land_8_20_14_0_20_39_15]